MLCHCSSTFFVNIVWHQMTFVCRCAFKHIHSFIQSFLLVRSHHDNCNGLLCGITDQLLCRLQKVQNNAGRVMSGFKTFNRITPILKKIHRLLIRKKIEFKILLLTFKCMQGSAPPYVRELLVRQASTRTLRSNIKNLLQIPHTNLGRFGESILCLCTTP